MGGGKDIVVIIGAGPAGLTAAWELLEQTDLIPWVFEMGEDVGGIAKTVEYKGNRIDIGGHRFFSRSDRVMDWWTRFLPLDAGAARGEDIELTYHGHSRDLHAANTEPPPEPGLVMLIRERVSRILFRRTFFDYPISFSLATVRNLGFVETALIGFSYLRTRITPRREEDSLERFFIHRFGERLYRTFFKDYTEKVWGVPCREIRPEWGAQRVKGLSITRAIVHALRTVFSRDESVEQKDVETSLIERFLYPRLGPGQLWQEVARRVEARGGRICFAKEAVALHVEGERITSVTFRDTAGGDEERVEGAHVLSTMPVRELVERLDGEVPAEVRRVAMGLQYRDFITVGLLLDELAVKGAARDGAPEGLIPDNWIYVQEPDVRVGRLQIFNNWSPAMVAEPGTVWLGMEYFCDEGDDLWSMTDDAMLRFAADELEKIGFIDAGRVRDGVVLRVRKTYPAYFGTYDEFDIVRRHLDRIENLFLVGRNGMHRYNNQDHSMLTAMTAVENIRDGVTDKENIWSINTEDEYHETK